MSKNIFVEIADNFFQSAISFLQPQGLDMQEAILARDAEIADARTTLGLAGYNPDYALVVGSLVGELLIELGTVMALAENDKMNGNP